MTGIPTGWYIIRGMLRSTLFCLSLLSLTAAAQYKPAFSAAELKLPGKKGACFTLREPRDKQDGSWEQNLPKLAKLKPSWNYSWGLDLVSQQSRFVDSEFIPMTWSGRSVEHMEERLRQDLVPQIRRKKVKRLLAFNEPDGKKQANMSVELALSLWPTLEKLKIPLCSPSAVHPDREWMESFMEGAGNKGYRVDYIGVHHYGGTNAKHFKDKLKRAHEMYGGRLLLVTEFACADWNTKGDFSKNGMSPGEVLAFAKEVLPWMEEQDWIAGYAWFSFEMHQPQGYTSALVHADGSLTALGRYYASISPDNPKGDQGIEPDDPKEHLEAALKAAAAHKK